MTPSAENPEKLTGLQVEGRKAVAAGLTAVGISLRMVIEEAGVVRGNKALLKMNQKGGFDCPSCAWPDPDEHRSPVAEYCENGAKALAEEATQKALGTDFFAEHSVYDLSQLSDFEIGKKGRISQPMYLAQGATHYRPIGWQDAFQKIGRHLQALDSPDEAIFYTSGRTSNEAAFLYQLFVREYGTNNLPDCSNMCHESSGLALNESLGIGKGSVTLDDFYEAEVILVIGQNPGTNHPRMMTALQKGKRNGAKIVAINPLPEAGLIGFNNPQTVRGLLNIDSSLTDLYIQIRTNGDMALIQAVERLLLDEEDKAPGSVFDLDFIQQKTHGSQEFLDHLRSLDFDALVAMSGVHSDKVRELANLILHKQKIIICWAMGLTQHANSVDTIKEVVNLLLLKGSIGKPGAGTCPVRGHSNVQGDRTMGIWEKVNPVWRENIRSVYGFEVPEKDGYDVVNAIHAMHQGKAKVFFALGGNFLSATPDTLYTAQGLRQCALTVQVSTKLNRSHLVHGQEALILPTLGRSDRDVVAGEEQFITCENSMGVVQASRGMLKPISEQLLSEPVIICELAKATLGTRSKVDWELYAHHYDNIRNDIARVIPGCEGYNHKVRRPAGFYLPNGAREGKFNTSVGKAVFNRAEATVPACQPGEYLMMTIRSHDQFNTTIYGLDDRYRGIHQERRVVFMNMMDMMEAHLSSGSVVDLVNMDGGVERMARTFVVVAYDIPQGCVATYFPEANVLVPIGKVAKGSHTPAYKTVVIQIKKPAK
ncbi:FdhF/YdeP family oxidoreductase [Arundinibacter roseus]|uniref:FdhF/YdeP family oxidoreductase n=1 Tax=Arundinibacter roseus TaxID=2070510 RepID=A0A4R4KMV1_9BACT|nr:FdhF/YdeP family oxidoreductase [Arundinibacter roseus]TDB68019.1 FdhF/YdeP family oxidoreductase [Arundinibacter roseus]